MLLADVHFIVELTSHIPDPHEKTALYNGWYSNRTRGFRKARGLLKVAGSVASPSAEATRLPVAVRQAWARLIRKIYAADPLVCPRCGGLMKVIAAIERDDIIFRILSHLGLVPAEDPSRVPPDDAAAPRGPKALAPVPVPHDLPFPEAAYARYRPVRPPRRQGARPLQPTARCRAA